MCIQVSMHLWNCYKLIVNCLIYSSLLHITISDLMDKICTDIKRMIKTDNRQEKASTGFHAWYCFIIHGSKFSKIMQIQCIGPCLQTNSCCKHSRLKYTIAIMCTDLYHNSQLICGIFLYMHYIIYHIKDVEVE